MNETKVTMKQCIMLVFGLLLTLGAGAQQASIFTGLEAADKAEFWSEQGWIFNEEAKAVDGMIDFEDLQISRSNVPFVSVQDFDPETFNPADYIIPLKQDKPVYVQVGDRGVIFFYSLDRLDVLYQRHLLNQAAKAKK